MKQEEKWEYMYSLLVLYKKDYGDTDVSINYVTTSGKKLGKWVHNQRQFYKNNKLAIDRLEKLRLLDFRFDNIDFDEKWNHMYNLLIKYKQKYGDTDVSSRYVTTSGKRLGGWVQNQRQLYKDNKLAMDRVEKLRLLDFRFDNIDFDEKWNHMYNLLVQYKEKYGSVEVYRSYVAPNGENLGKWVNTQRQLYKNNKLAIDRVEKLRLFGFRFDSDYEIKSNRVYSDIKWNHMYNLLVRYKEKYGDTEVSRTYVAPDGENLGTWIGTQRQFYKNNKLAIDRVEKLRLLDFRFGINMQMDFINDDVLLDYKLIRKMCLAYNINYDRFKGILDKLSYSDFASRLYYLLDNYMDIVDDDGNLNIIFGMDNDSLYLYTDFTSDELKSYYNKKYLIDLIDCCYERAENKTPIRIRKR